MQVEKAIAISDAKIQFVSLVDKAANKRQFLITKADEVDLGDSKNAASKEAQFMTGGKILKVDDDTHYVTGIVYEPLVEDAHGDFMTEDEIRKAAYWFAKNGDKVDLQHSFEPIEGVAVVENYVAPCAMEIGGAAIAKGTWLMTAEVQNEEIWEKVQKGEVTGFSMGGTGNYSEQDVEIAAATKKGIFKKMAELFGLDVIDKSEVKEKFTERVKGDNFWSAWNALSSTLYSYDWESDTEWFETDEAKIRSALSEFSEIVTALLMEDEVIKSLVSASTIAKAGKKISSANKKKLDDAYQLLTELCEALEQTEGESNIEKKEAPDMTREEIQKMITDAVEKITKTAPTDDPPPADGSAAPAETLNADAVQKMIDESIKKALDEQGAAAPPEPAAEPLTPEAVQKMIADSIAPILKARGLPSNLNDQTGPIDKSADGAFDGFFIDQN